MAYDQGCNASYMTRFTYPRLYLFPVQHTLIHTFVLHTQDCAIGIRNSAIVHVSIISSIGCSLENVRSPSLHLSLSIKRLEFFNRKNDYLLCRGDFTE